MAISFSELWEKSEGYYEESIKDTDISSILEELNLKTSLFKSVVENSSISQEEKFKIIEHTYGELLMTMTQMSLKLNINSYKALKLALHYKEISDLSEKY